MDIKASRWVKWGDQHLLGLPEKLPEVNGSLSAAYKTARGRLYCGKIEAFLDSRHAKRVRRQVQLVFTSPPFPLTKKKRYGNLQGDAYVDWFADLAPKLRELLTTDGSIVVEIGNVWEPGRPVMSTVVPRALLEFLNKAELKLCQEFIWYNPARLPSPIQWVNVERIRVKDAFSRVWWMSAVDRPKADNRKVLRAYSDSMKKLLRTGKYNSGLRPSEHRIGKESFKKTNDGAIPPSVIGGDAAEGLGNLLKATNTRSVEQYQLFCRDSNLGSHPARMPTELAEFFIKFLTDERDLVLDPFAGSNTTGQTAEALRRRWISVEARWDYAIASLGRFDPAKVSVLADFVNQSASMHVPKN